MFHFKTLHLFYIFTLSEGVFNIVSMSPDVCHTFLNFYEFVQNHSTILWIPVTVLFSLYKNSSTTAMEIRIGNKTNDNDHLSSSS